MNKRFLITEDERNSILSLYTKKGIILEQDRTSGMVDTGESNNTSYKTFRTPPFGKRGSRKVKMLNNRLYLIDKNDQDINGNHKEFYVDLTTGTIKDTGFLNNIDFINDMGGFGSIERDMGRPTNTDGNFKTIMINYENSGANSSVYVGEPALCTIRISARKISLFAGPSSNRSKSDSSNIDLTQYYIPKNKNEWETIKDKLYGSNNSVKDMSFKDFVRGGYAIFLEPAWPDTSFGEITPVDEDGDDTVSIEIILKMENPFQFNRTFLYPEGVTELKKFVDDIKEVKNTYGETVYNDYINFLNSKKIEVLTSSSIDDDPNQTIKYIEGEGGNAVAGCGGTQTRNKYNFCLSEQRAIAIINQLKTYLPELSGTTIGGTAFIPKPIGETSQFDEVNTWPKVTGKDDKEKAAKTAKNRVVLITLPSFKKNYDN